MDEEKRAVPEWGRHIPGELLESWPKDEDGSYEPPVYLCHCTGLDMDDTLLVSRMQSFGIPVLRQNPSNGDFGRLILGVSGTGVDIFVPASLWSDATELLKEPEEVEEDE